MLSATVGLLPFATTYGLIYWAEQYVTSGLTSVLFGVLPLYVALLAAADRCRRSRCARGCCVGVGVALAGLVVAFSESLDLGEGEHTALATLAVILCPIASRDRQHRDQEARREGSTRW